jgi:D-arginine dehydrogenase
VAELGCDVLVIGGGMAGVSLAAAVASRDVDVIVAEAEAELGRHATGRSAATYVPSYGPPLVRALTVASREAFDAIAEEHGGEILRPLPILMLATDDDGDVALRGLVAETGALQPLDPAAVVRRWPVLRPDRVVAGGLDSDAMAIEVAGMHQVYLRRLRRLGGRVLTGAPVRTITPSGAGWRVAAGEHTVEAQVVVDAAGAWVDAVAAVAGVPAIGLEPRRRSAFLTPVPARWADDAAGWPMVIDAADRWYVKPDGGQLLVSPADETPSEPCDARPDDLEVARAIEAVNDCTDLAIRHVSTAWAGLRSFVADGLPVVGARPERPGFFFYAGQGGYGIQMAPALAALGAAILTTGEAPEQVAALGVTAAAVSPSRPTLGPRRP